MDAGAVDQRDRESVVRLPGFGRRRRLHVGNQQSAASDYAMVKRSGERSSRRGALRSGPGYRRAVGTDRAADPRGWRAVRRSSRPGLQHLRAHLARNFARADAVRSAGRLSQDFAAEDSQSLAARATSVGHRLRRVGARHVARRLRPIHRHRDRARNSRGTGAQLFQHRIRKPDRIRRPARQFTLMDGGPNGVSRPQRHARQSRRARCWQAAVRKSRSRDGSVRGAANHGVAPAECSDRGGFLSGRGGEQAGSDCRRSRNIAPPTSTLFWPRSRSTGTACWARCRSRLRTARWTSCSTDGCCIRPLRAACGRAPRSTRRGERTAFAISSRT